jgi:hypothetical protein
MPAKNKYYSVGHEDFVPMSVAEMRQHSKAMAGKKKMKKKARRCPECGQKPCGCSDY